MLQVTQDSVFTVLLALALRCLFHGLARSYACALLLLTYPV